MGSLPPSLAIVCNVFMYVFVNVTEVFGEGRGGAAAATLRSVLPTQAPSRCSKISPFPLLPSGLPPLSQQAARGSVWKGYFKAVG